MVVGGDDVTSLISEYVMHLHVNVYLLIRSSIFILVFSSVNCFPLKGKKVVWKEND